MNTTPSGITTILAGITMILLLITCNHADAGDGFKAKDIRVEIGGGYTNYNHEQTDSGAMKRGTIGVDDFPIYLYGTQQDSSVRILGQEIAWGDATTVGLGVEYEIARNLTLFGEVGYALMDFDINSDIVHESVYTHLVGNHYVDEVRTPPILNYTCRGPAPCGNEQYRSEWTLDDSYEFRIGVAYRIFEYGVVTFSYRSLEAKEYMAIKDDEWLEQVGNSWWEESNYRDFSGFEVNVMGRF